MKAPTNLSHKPILTVEDYDFIDGKYVENTDAKALSIGLAQWDVADLSGKVWRHSGNKWSRQSEELPLHRILDLSILTIASFIEDPESDFALTNLGEKIINKENFHHLSDYLLANEKRIKPRVEEIKRISTLFLEKLKK